MITKPTYWTKTRIILTLESMLSMIKSETNPKTWHITLGGLCQDFDIYRELIPIWSKEYPDEDEIIHPIKRIHQILENRVNEGALRNQLNFVSSIFNLKNNYGWKDTQEIADHRLDKQSDDIAEIRDRLATRRNRNIKNKKNAK